MAGTLHQSHVVRGFHLKSEVPVWKGPIEAGDTSILPPDSHLTSSQARTSLLQSSMPPIASETAVQRVQGRPNIPGQPPPPPEQADQPDLRPISLRNLLNPIKSTNANKHDMLALPSTRSPPRHQQSQEDPQFQIQSYQDGVNLAPQQPVSQIDSSCTHHSASGQVRHTEPAQASPVVFTSQPQRPLSNSLLSSDLTSTVAQIAFGTEGQHQMMIINTGSGLQQIPVNANIASKASNEKRKRKATACHSFRQRRKEKEEENAKKISNLEQRIRELEGEKEFLRMERDLYRGQSDIFREAAQRTSSQASILPRPLTPRQSLTALNAATNDRWPCPMEELRSQWGP